MKADLWRLTGVLCGSLIVGLFTGYVQLCLIVGLGGYLYWHFYSLRELLAWIRQRGEKSPPDQPGIVDTIAREIDFLRLRHRQRKEKLSGFLKRFQEATAALPDAAVVLGDRNNIEWANSLAEQYLDIRWPRDAGNRIVNLIRHPALPEFLQNNNPDPADRLIIESPGSTDTWLELRITPYGENQRLLVARDISRLHRLAQMRKDFIANASHELRTPLTVISGYLEGMEEDGNLDPEVRRSQIRLMRDQARRMQRLTDDLLRLATLESTTEPEQPEVIRIPELIAGIEIEARALSGLLAHRFSLEVDPALWLRGSQYEIYSAFSNIVLNAVQYSDPNTVIRIRWYEDSQGVHFQVSDQGPGIDSRHLPRLTERFYRVDKGRSSEKGGTGLGLAIVKHVLNRHKATLEIDSVPGRGSTFRCNFLPEMIVRKGRDHAVDMTA